MELKSRRTEDVEKTGTDFGTRYRKLFLVFIIIFMGWTNSDAQIPAFPGADGFGMYTTGGRGGSVIEVTNLNDKGPGSLREAIALSGPRTIVFRVSGTIYLESDIRVKKGDLTIAGQTAPGDGITLANYNFYIEANNVIMRYLRCRLGDVSRQQSDAFSCNGTQNVIVDHCSFSWSVDEVASCYSNKNFTMQYCIISESLYNSVHEKDEHGYGGIWGGSRASFHHNLIAHNTSRNPRFNGARYNSSPWEELVDHRNNVIYNWGFNSAYGGEPSEIDGVKAKINVVSNYYKAGPATRSGEVSYRILSPDAMSNYGYSNWYIDSNVVALHPEVFSDNWGLGVQGVSTSDKEEMREDIPFEHLTNTIHTAEEAYIDVLENAGCILPRSDTIDKRIRHEVATGTASFGGATWGAGKGIIDSQEDVGGWPELFSGRVPDDFDNDGMSDEWEDAQGLDKEDPEDRNGDINADGYTNLENYLNSLDTYPDFIHPPTLFKAVLVEKTMAELSWKDNSNNEEGYFIDRNDGSGFSRFDTLEAETTSFIDSELLYNTYYTYRIMAFTESDSSIMSESLTLLTPGEFDPPEKAYAPYPSDNKNLVSLKPLLSWSSGLGTISHRLHMGTSNPPGEVAILNDTFYIPGELEEGTTYYWQVNEINENGETLGDIWKFTSTIDLSNRLVGHWAMESVNKVADSSFFQNHGTLTGYFPFSTTINGAVDKAVSFNGSTQYAKIAHKDIFNFKSGSFSVACWIKQEESTIDGPKDFAYLIKGSHLANANAGTSGKRYELYFDGATNTMRFEIDDNSFSTYVATEGTAYLNGQWTHITGIRDTVNNQLHIFLNGILKNSATDISGDISEEEALYFALGGDFDTHLPGSLDDIRLYNYILSDQEIAQLVAKGPVGIDTKSLNHIGFYIYPNPATKEFNIRIQNSVEDDINLELIDNLGQTMKTILTGETSSTEISLKVPVEHLEPGFYYVRLKNAREQKVRRLIIY